MRPEIKEYNFDWLLWSTLSAAGKLSEGSRKERDRMLKYIPYFKGILDTLLAEGKPGELFLKMLGEYTENIMTAKEKGNKLGITTFCFSPAIFYAMNIMPITFEVMTVLAGAMWKRASYDYLDFCTEVGFSETGCSSQRGALGAYLAGLSEEIDVVVTDTPGVCDTNANAFAFAASYLDKPFFQLNYPPVLVDGRTDRYQMEDFRALVKFLEDVTGNRLDQDRLREIIKEMQVQDQLLSDLQEMEKMVPHPLPNIYNLFVYAGRFMFAGIPIYTELLQSMIEAGMERVRKGESGLKSGREKLRAYFFYIDHYMLNLSLWDFLDQHGVAYIGNILSHFFANNASYAKERQEETYAFRTDSLDNMLLGIAEMNSRMPMVRTIRGPYDAPHMWLDDTLALAKLYKADCLIYNGTPGCRNTWGMLKPMARDTEKAGIPTHIMYADAFDGRIESWEASQARLLEFFEIRNLL